MVDNYRIHEGLKQAVEEKGLEIQPQSGLTSLQKVSKLATAVETILKAQGDCDDDKVFSVLNESLPSLVRSWHAYELEAQRAVERYFKAGAPSHPCPSGPSGSGGDPGQGQGGSGGDSDGDGNGQGQGKGQGQGQGEGQGEGQGDGEGKEPEPPKPRDPEDEPIDPDYIAPAEWDKVMAIMKWNMKHPGKQKNIMLVGPRGVGKTEMVIQIVKKFWGPDALPSMITSPQAKHEVCGYGDAQGRPVLTQFTEGYTKPGVVLVEEIDRSDATPLIAANAATANKIMDTPVVGMIRQHPECTIIATANTAGVGATEEYITANQLDASTRDRYVYIKVSFDKAIALKIARKDRALVDFVEKWNVACEVCGLIQSTCSYRALVDIKDTMDMGFSITEALEMCVLKECMPKDNLRSVLDRIKNKANVYTKAMIDICDRMVDVATL